MTDRQTVIWNGASGNQYTYWVYTLPTGLNTGQDGNYIYTKIVNGVWIPIYIGQGDLGDRTNIDTTTKLDASRARESLTSTLTSMRVRQTERRRKATFSQATRARISPLDATRRQADEALDARR